MRVFVVGTGRCGTSTFFHACLHIRNYGTGHESKRGVNQIGNWSFPDDHIEIASNLTIGLNQLRGKYPEALWVRLKRNREDCIKSLAEQSSDAMLDFAHQWWYLDMTEAVDNIEVASQFYDFCEDFYQNCLPADALFFDLEHIKEHWIMFWNQTKADGDYLASLQEWDRQYNAADHRGLDEWK